MAKKKAAKRCSGLKCTAVYDGHCNNRTDVVRMQRNEAGSWFWYGWSKGNNRKTHTSGEPYSSTQACHNEAFDHAVQLGVPLEVWE